jgi:hypothetical protein
VNAGKLLTFGAGSHTASGASSISGAGTVKFNAVTTFSGSYNVTGDTQVFVNTTFDATSSITSLGSALTVSGGTATFNSGDAISLQTLTQSTGGIAGSDSITVLGDGNSGTTDLNWTGGTMSGTGTTTVSAGATVALSSSTAKTLSRPLVLSGSATQTGTGNLQFFGGTLTVSASGVYDIQSDADLTNNGGTNSVTNAGTFKKTGGTATSTVAVPFNSSGTVIVNAGALELGGGDGGIGHSGSFQGTANLLLTGVTHTLSGSVTVANMFLKTPARSTSTARTTSPRARRSMAALST